MHSYKVNSSHSFFVDCMMDFLYNLSRNFVPNFNERKKRKMKHRVLSILLALTFLVSVCLFCTSAFAATGAQDGVTAELTTDKAEYAAGESINVTLVVTNTNVRVNNLRTELVLPAGVTLTTGALVNEGATMAPGTEAKFEYGLTVDAAEVPTTTPGGDNDGPAETGDYSMIIFGMLAVASLVGLIALTGMKNIFKQRWFVLVLCGALLLGVVGPVVATATATTKTFEVTENVTLAGVAAEIKAIVSYDLNDEIVHTEEVAFKKDGQFLWAKEVEQGYYLPSDVTYDGKKTSKDGAYRPEVNAPYIDMLFGCNNQSGAFVKGEFTKEIFNADATQTALIGLTDDPASRAALEMIGKDEWIIAVIDGKLVVTGWYDNASAAAARALYALATADATDITLTLPMIGKMDYVHEAPAFTAGEFLGAMDSDFGSVVMRYNKITEADFDAYCATLEAAGYELYESNTMDGFKKTATLRFATYVKGDDVVLVQYLPMSLTLQDPATLNSAEMKAYEASFYADGESIRVILTSTNRLGNNAEANTGWTDAGISPKVHLVNGYDKYSDGNNIGLSELFVLADGSFVVVDGGSNADSDILYRTMKIMNEREDGKIVVAAWILSHAHADHTGALGSLSGTEYASEITVEQVILNHVAVSYRYRSSIVPYGYNNGFSAEFANIESIAAKFAQGEDCKIVTPHMGQVMKIRNAEIEFLTVGDEDVYPVLFNNDNGQSLVFRVTFPGTTDQEFMCTADSALDQTYNVFFPLMADELRADILTVAHHGLGGQTSRFYPMFKNVEVVIWHTDSKTINKNNLMTSSTNAGLQAFNPLNIITEEYVKTLHIPFNKETDEVIRTKVSTFKSKFQDAEMDIALLPAFRFGAQWTAKKDIIISYLKEYTSDVLILPLVDKNAQRYNKTDVANELAEALDYAYAYYAPVWGCDAEANMETGDGTVGHLILSTYPILKAETGILVEGTPDAKPEGRGYAHVLLDVEGVKLDLVATHFNDAGNWTAFAEKYEQWGKYTIIAGNTKIKGDGTQVGEGVTSAFTTDITILGSEGITFTNAATDNRLATEGSEFYINKSPDPMFTATAKFSLYVAPEETTAPVRQAFVNWWVNTWGRDYGSFQKVVKALKEVNPAVVAFHMVNHEALGMTEEQVKAELGYPYALWVPNSATADGKWSGHYLVSHYPIEDLGVLEVSNGSDDAADQYKQRRAFGHAVVTIDGTEVDVWFGSVGPGAPKQVAKLEAAVNATATETGRPFIISTNDAGMKDVKSFAGYTVYNYWTAYETNVLVSEGKVAVTGTETKDAGVGWAGVDVMNILDIEVKKSPVIGNWWINRWGGGTSFAPAVEIIREYDLPIITLQQISNGTVGATAEQVAMETGYEFFYCVDKVHVTNAYEINHMILSHYPIEALEDVVLVDYNTGSEGRKFGHVIVDIYGTKVDVYFGATDWLSEQNLKDLEAVVAKFATETGRPFIVSGNDMATDGLTSYAGVEVYNYRTGYVSAVLVSKGALEVTKTETIKTAISAGGIDDLNLVYFDTTDGGLKPGDPYEPPVTPEPDPEPDPEPEVPEEPTDDLTLTLGVWGVNGTSHGDNLTAVKGWLKENKPDIMGLVSFWKKNGDVEIDVDALAEELGYKYGYYAKKEDGGSVERGCVILSMYEMTFVKTDSHVNYYTVELNGKTYDVFTFFDLNVDNTSGSNTVVEKINKETGNEFIVFGHRLDSGITNYAGKNVTQAVGSRSSVLVSEGIAASNVKNNIAKPSATSAHIDNIATLDATFEKAEETIEIEKLNVISWWCSYKSQFNNGTNRANAIAMLTAQNADILVLSNINLSDGAGTVAAEAAAYGYYYYDFVAFDPATDPEHGTLMMSKYPFNFVEEFTAVNNYKLITFSFNGKTLDFYFGGFADTSVSYADLAAKIKARQEETKNAFIVAMKGAPQTLGSLLTGMTDADGNAVTTFAAFWGTANGVLVSSPMTATEVAINPTTNGFANTNGMGDRAILAPVIFP